MYLKAQTPEAYFNLGNLYNDQGKLPKAEQMYLKAQIPDAYFNLGNLYNDQGKLPEAEQMYLKAQIPKAYNNLGNLYFDQEKFDEAKKFYYLALSNDNDPICLGNLARLLFVLQENEEGLKAIEKAFSLQPNNQPLILELHFYRYAHSRDVTTRTNSLYQIKLLLLQSIRSKTWNLTFNTAIAIKSGHPEPEFLTNLANVISDNQNITSLNKFSSWNTINVDK